MHDVPSMKPKLIYLDNNATTACAPEVTAEMLPFMSECFGNASSNHYSGRMAFRAVEEAREKLASALSVKKYELYFNSGATEGNNWIFLSMLKSRPAKTRILISAIEHKAVLLSAHELRKFGFDVVELPVTENGTVDLDMAESLITPEAALVSVQFANNETGVIQPISKLIEIAHRNGALFHCDAVQGLGKSKLNFSEMDIDCGTFSAHKIHGPKGVGALFLRRGAREWKWEYPFMGGGQEHDVRPGTLNVPGIVGFGKAAELLLKDLPQRLSHMLQLQKYLEQELEQKIPGCKIHGKNSLRIPNTTNVGFPGIPADILMANLPLFCISEGSACNSGAIGVSHVLQAMRIPADTAEASVRISTSYSTTKDEVIMFLDEVCKVTKQLGGNCNG